VVWTWLERLGDLETGNSFLRLPDIGVSPRTARFKRMRGKKNQGGGLVKGPAGRERQTRGKPIRRTTPEIEVWGGGGEGSMGGGGTGWSRLSISGNGF